MRITQPKVVFKPISIVAETEAEIAALRNIVAFFKNKAKDRKLKHEYDFDTAEFKNMFIVKLFSIFAADLFWETVEEIAHNESDIYAIAISNAFSDAHIVIPGSNQAVDIKLDI